MIGHDCVGRYTYNEKAQLTTFTTDRSDITCQYDPQSGQLTDINGAEGGLLTQQRRSKNLNNEGTNGTVGFSYDNNLNLHETRVKGQQFIAHLYDSDDLLCKVGPLAVTHIPVI